MACRYYILEGKLSAPTALWLLTDKHPVVSAELLSIESIGRHMLDDARKMANIREADVWIELTVDGFTQRARVYDSKSLVWNDSFPL